MKKLNKKQDSIRIKDIDKSLDEPEISPEFKKELNRVRKEVKSGKYVVYKTWKKCAKGLSR